MTSGPSPGFPNPGVVVFLPHSFRVALLLLLSLVSSFRGALRPMLPSFILQSLIHVDIEALFACAHACLIVTDIWSCVLTFACLHHDAISFCACSSFAPLMGSLTLPLVFSSSPCGPFLLSSGAPPCFVLQNGIPLLCCH